MNGHQKEAFSYLIGALKSPRKVNGYGADYAYCQLNNVFPKFFLFFKVVKVWDRCMHKIIEIEIEMKLFQGNCINMRLYKHNVYTPSREEILLSSRRNFYALT